MNKLGYIIVCVIIGMLCQSCLLINRRRGTEQFAKEYIQRNYGTVDSSDLGSLISKRKAVRIAKKEVFETYGFWMIIGEKPYNKHYIGSYLYMNGSIRKDRKGGVFMVVIDRKTGAVKERGHGK